MPYGKIRDVFEKEGRGVFLPYEKFQELWQQARGKFVPPAAEQAPVGILLVEADNEARVEKDVVIVHAKILLEVLGKGWHEAPLRLKDAAIRSATINDAPARITFTPENGYRLMLHHDRAEATRLTLQLEYAKAFSKSPGQNSVSLEAPQVPVNRWQIRVPQSGVKVNVQPMIAATEVPATPAAPPSAPPSASAPGTPAPAAAPAPAAPNETVIQAFVGAAPEVRIDWTPKAEGAAGMEALTSVQAEQEVVVEEGAVRTRVRLAYEISRAEVSQLAIEVPADQKVTGVFDPNVRQWTVAAEQDKQVIRVQLFEAVRGTQNLSIELERFVDVVSQELLVPVVRAAGVSRQQGVVVVRLGEELQGEATRRSGLLQLDKGELPASLQNTQWLFAYRYAMLPFELALKIQKVEPKIRAKELVELYISPELITCDLTAVLEVERGGVFQLDVAIPAGFQVRQVRGLAVAGVEAVQVDTHHVDAADPTQLKVNLSRKANSKLALFVELERNVNDANLTSPTGKTSEIPLAVPRIANKTEHATGHVLVYGPESLRINPLKQTGLRSVPFAEAQQDVPSQREKRFGELREVLAFAYAQPPVELSLGAERRKPFVTVSQLFTVRIDSGVARYDATFNYDVQYSPVKTLRIDVPVALADKIRNLTPSARDLPLDPQPEGLAKEGYQAWGLTGEAEFFGKTAIRFSWEDRQSELAIGKSAEYTLPVLRPMGADRSWGQIVLTKGETLDIRPKTVSAQLRPIDPQHDLMDGARVPDAARAFEFHDPNWTCSVTATRYQLEEVKRTSIERAVLRMVVTRSDKITVQGIYRMRSAAQRIELQVPDNAVFDTDPLRINGRAVPMERGDKQQFFVPLVNLAADQSFVLELRYTVPDNQRRLDFPVFAGNVTGAGKPAVQKVFLFAYLPEEMALLGSRGPWTSESGLGAGLLDWLEPSADARTATEKIQWVTEAIVPPNQIESTFATDGKVYVFSAIQPQESPAGSLWLVAVSRRVLNAIVFGCMIIIALMFVRSTPLRKLFVLALTIVGLILAAVFVPTFASQLATGSFFAALCVVLLVWLVAIAVPRREKSKARADAAPAEKAKEEKLEPQPMNETLQDADAAKSEFKPEQPLDGGSSNA